MVAPAQGHKTSKYTNTRKKGSAEQIKQKQYGSRRKMAIETKSGVRIQVGGRDFRTRPDRHRDPPILLYKGYRVFLGGKVDEAWR